MIIISIDPGQTSGYVVYDTEKDKVVTFGVLTGEHKAVIDFILQWKADIIVCEDFRPRPGMGHALAKHERQWSTEIIGTLRYFYEDKLVLQQPSQGKMIKAVPGNNAHERDAFRHLYYWFAHSSGLAEHYAERIRKALVNESEQSE